MGRSPPAKPAGAGANKPSGWGPSDNLAEPAEPAGAGADEPSGWGPPDNLAEPAESAGAGADEPSGWNRAAWQSEPRGFISRRGMTTRARKETGKFILQVQIG